MKLIGNQTLQRIAIHVPLRWVLIVPFVVPMIGATVLVGYLSYRSEQAAVQDLGHQLMAQTHDQITQELRHYLQTPLLINRLNVDRVTQGYLNPQDVAALEAALFQRLQQFDQVSAVLFASPEGRFRVVERFPDWYLGVADPARSDDLRIYRLDREGNRGALAHEVRGFDVRRDRPFYQRAVTTGQPGWSPIARYGNSNALTLDASQPVYDPTTRQLLGVFAVHLRLEYLNQLLDRLAIAQAGQVIITDQNGALIATSTGEQPYRYGDKITQPHQFQQLPIEQSQNPLTRSLGQYLRERPDALTPIKQTQFLEFHQFLEFYYGNQPHYAQITPFQDQYGLNWRIITVVPRSHFLAAIQANTRITILLCLLTLGVAVGLALLAASLLTARFAQLSRVSHNLAGGNLDQRLPTDGWIEELNDLSQTFNQMADRMQQSFDRIKTALAESEEKFTTIFRTSPEAVTIASFADGRILEVNHSLLEFSGYSAAELVGSTALELGLWHSLQQRQQYRTLLKQQRSVRNLEVQLRTRSGEVRTVLLSAEVRTLEGQDRVIVMLRDISDRKRVEDERKAAERALQQSEARYRAIVEDQTELITRSLPDTTLTFVNDAYCRYFNVNREAVIGKSYRQLIYEPDQNQVTQRIDAMSLTNPTFTMENRVVVNGQVRWVQWIDRLLFDAEGNITELQAVGRDITHLKQIEEALRKSEARLSLAQQVAQIGSWEWDLLTQKRTWTELTYCHWGRDRTLGEPSYAELLQMVHPDDRAMLQQKVQNAIHQGVAYSIDLRVVHPDGSIRYLDSRVEPLFDDQGQVIKLLGTSIDVTQRKHTEQTLQEREAMLRAIGDNLPRGYIYQCTYEPGQRSRYSYVSAGIERLLGLKPEDVLRDSQVLRTIGFEEDIAKAKQIVQDAIENQKPFEIIMRNQAVPGEIRWSSLRETPRQLADGRIVWDGVEIDITELKQIEAALRESEERFRRAFDDAPIGISLVSSTGQFVKVNPSYCNLVGYSEAELLGLKFQDISHPADAKEDLAGFQQMLDGEIRTFQMQKRYVSKQGTDVPVFLSAAAIRDPEGRVLYIVGHVLDIRDRLKVERMKDEFISVVSHELRTPLTSIRGALGILGSGVFNDRPAQAQQMLKIAINNSDRLVRLVNDILTLERLESGKVPLVMEPCQVSDLMQQAVDSVQPLADQSAITLAVSTLPAILCAAPDAIIQTLINLLSNAIKFSTAGNTVWLRAERQGYGGMGGWGDGEMGSKGDGEMGSKGDGEMGRWGDGEQGRWGAREMGSNGEMGRSVDSEADPSTPAPLTPSPPHPLTPSLPHPLTPSSPHPLTPSSPHPLPPSPHLLFTVQDQGRGIPADKLELIFEQFQQVDISDSRRKGGTGLGLTICKKIVQEHGGRIWAESILGEGSTFYFTLPIRDCHSAE